MSKCSISVAAAVDTYSPGGEVIYRRLGLINPLELKKVIVEYLGRTYK